MAGILFQREQTELVTLTTQPNDKCQQYHQRMPALILARDKDYWFNSPTHELAPLLQHVEDRVINIKHSD
ncbi:hypothetical protein KO502_03435 [Colwellia sp. E2M01]|nr:hypothetical protein [Colwellia sp. E2M01]MBU2869736.1 hypothetical protein [Colwellia sp. E2M01]